jgi:hypothetical protein
MFDVPNYIGYLLISVISVVLLIYTFIKDRKNTNRNFSVYFFIAGLSFILEFFILVCFNAYQYRPHVFNYTWHDNILGSFTSQALAIPSAAVFLAAFQLSWLWIAGLSLFFVMVELLFLYLNIYGHHWWSIVYTAILLPIGFTIAQKWFKWMTGKSNFIRFFTIYLGLNTYAQTLKYFLYVFMATHQYRIGVFSDQHRDSIFGNSIYLAIITVLMTYVIVFKFKWYWAAAVACLEWVLTSILVRFDILILGDHWRIGYFPLLLLSTLILFRWIYLKLFNEEGFFEKKSEDQHT